MVKTEVIKARVRPDLKKEVEQIFERLGLSADEAISLFYHHVKLYRGLPFNVRVPNRATIKTFKDTDAGKNLIRCKDADDMFRRLGILKAEPGAPPLPGSAAGLCSSRGPSGGSGTAITLKSLLAKFGRPWHSLQRALVEKKSLSPRLSAAVKTSGLPAT